MDYDDLVKEFFAPNPEGTSIPDVVRSLNPARRLRDAIEPLAMHAVWCRSTVEALTARGLGVFEAYVGGRAACLGEPSAAVVVAAFAWFDQQLITNLYAGARAALPREQLVAIRDEATTSSLTAVLGPAQPAVIADILADAALAADGTGRPLFSGLRERGRPADPVRRLWWACDLIREHRGDSHIAAANAAGLGPVQMNILTELWLTMPLFSYTATRGWSLDAMQQAHASLEARGLMSHGRLTPAGRQLRNAVEECTNAQEQSIIDTIGDRFEQVRAQLEEWSALCVAAGTFPPDVIKRAAG